MSRIFISSYIPTMELLAKRMVVSYTFAAPAVIVNLPIEEPSFFRQKRSNLACQTPILAAVNSKLPETQNGKWDNWRSENQRVLSVLQKIGKTSSIFWKLTLSIAVCSSTSSRSSHPCEMDFGRTNLVKYRIELLPNANSVCLAPYQDGSAIWQFQRLPKSRT